MYENDRYYLLTEEELEHFGIKGMKWGVRRTPEQLGHKREKTSEQLAKAAKRKALAKKVAKYGAMAAGTAAIVAFGNVSVTNALASQVGGKYIKAGASAISTLLNIQTYEYKNLQSIPAQKLTQQLNGTYAKRGGYMNLQSIPAQKLQQYLRSDVASIGPNLTQKQAMELLFGK